MLMAYGDNFQLPDNVPANEFLNLEGDKISTSRNWAIWLHEYLRDFPGKQDVLRYVLTANAPETKDNDFTWRDFQTRNNSELVAILGNFVNRAVVLTHKYFDGVVPAAGNLTDIDNEALAELKAIKERLTDNLDNFRFREGLKEAMNIARLGNKYLQDTEPWKLAKTDMARVATVLNIAIQICGSIDIACEPFLPFMAGKLKTMLGLEKLEWADLGKSDLIASGTKLGEAQLLFEKIEDEAINAQLDRLDRIKKENQVKNFKPEPIAETIDLSVFEKADLRIGTVVECKPVKKAKKLLQFLIDDGLEQRTILSGIAEHYKAEDLVGKQVVFIANLAPREIRGIVSNGMILSALNADGSLKVISPSAPSTPGAKVC